ncbi:DoxX family protein [Arthrobacter bussei]|uniref:DoxX family membrane protein n=1 Tax=Arthrobacter bussei TaxID=2594179 RepID=A0A7X1TPW2_9MICC|nr:hypothetical protein [Arthrobacter bussei]MPY12068.1 hypothetical protein [Arthrobacter bussei]
MAARRGIGTRTGTTTARTSLPRTIARLVLGAFLLFAGTAHLTVARSEFAAQVPSWLPLDADVVVVASGVVELLLGAALVALGRYRVVVGWVVAAFFVAIFPGNIAQYVEGVSAFGLDTDAARLTRLFFQPVLVLWALWSTGAWRDRAVLSRTGRDRTGRNRPRR